MNIPKKPQFVTYGLSAIGCILFDSNEVYWLDGFKRQGKTAHNCDLYTQVNPATNKILRKHYKKQLKKLRQECKPAEKFNPQYVRFFIGNDILTMATSSRKRLLRKLKAGKCLGELKLMARSPSGEWVPITINDIVDLDKFLAPIPRWAR